VPGRLPPVDPIAGFRLADAEAQQTAPAKSQCHGGDTPTISAAGGLPRPRSDPLPGSVIVPGIRPSHSTRSAFTGSSRAARKAGISAATEQSRKAPMQMIATSEGMISAGMPSNS